MIKKLTPEQITEIINKVFEAVDKSKVGPIYMNKEKTDINYVAYQTYLAAIHFNIPARLVSQVIEPRESWQQEEPE